MRAPLLSPLLMLLPLSWGLHGQQPLQLDCAQSLFVAGTNDTHTYRIPAIVTAANGDLIAACDARRSSASDLAQQREIDIVFRRSDDGGATWTPQETLDPITDGGCSDPSFVVDRSTKEIFCFYNYMAADKSSKEYRFKYQKSRDHGRTWDAPVDFTDQVAGPEWKDAFKFITSGRGIQTSDGMLIHNFVRVGHGATLFASRDHGATWAAIGEVQPADESKVVELGDRTLMVNSRWKAGERYDHRSVDGGQSWKSTKFALPDPRCNASIVQYTCVREGFAKDRLLFCNAASNDRRENLTMRISYDQGATWSAATVIDAGPAAYSEITILLDGSIGVLYEPGYKEVRFVRFTLESLTGGQDHLEPPDVSVP